MVKYSNNIICYLYIIEIILVPPEIPPLPVEKREKAPGTEMFIYPENRNVYIPGNRNIYIPREPVENKQNSGPFHGKEKNGDRNHGKEQKAPAN